MNIKNNLLGDIIVNHLVFSTQAILDELDQRAENHELPMMDNVNYPFLAGRLNIYRDNHSWAIVFNTLSLEICSIVAIIDPVGADVKIDQLNENDAFVVVADFESNDETIAAQRVTIRGNEVNIAPELLAQINVLFEQSRKEDSITGEWDAAELLIKEYKEKLLPTAEEVARFFPKGLPPLFFSLDEWHHPDLAMDELPSSTETFQLIAKAICSGNVGDYASTCEPNTNRRNWEIE